MGEVTKKTGYAVYNEEAKKRTKRNTLEELYPRLPNRKYQIIYADPPWDYNGKMQFDKTSTTKDKVDLSKKIFISSASFKYPTLKKAELLRLPVSEIAADDSLLFLWATNPFLDQAIEIGTEWGFEYKTVAFVWNKMVHNPGKYTMSYCELCLLFKRGKIPQPRGSRSVKQLINSPRRRHSEKPIEAMVGINEMFPSQSKIELFARNSAPGWDHWGLDMIIDHGDSDEQRMMREREENDIVLSSGTQQKLF